MLNEGNEVSLEQFVLRLEDVLDLHLAIFFVDRHNPVPVHPNDEGLLAQGD